MIPPTGTVQAIEVHVDIEHTFVGDLQVELIAPSRRVVVLHDRKGGGQRDLRATWASSSLVGLATVVGEWVLRMRDTARRMRPCCGRGVPAGSAPSVPRPTLKARSMAP